MSRAKKLAEGIAALKPGDIVWYARGGEPSTVCTSCGHATPASAVSEEFAMVQTVHDDATLTIKLGVLTSYCERSEEGVLRVIAERQRQLPGRHVSRVPRCDSRVPTPGTWRLL